MTRKAARYEINDESRMLLEKSKFAYAIYQNLDNKVVVRLVSDGLIDMYAPDLTRAEIMDRINEDLYFNAHPDDRERIDEAVRVFANGGEHYDVLSSERLYGRQEYRKIRAQGYHGHFEDGSEYAVVQYTDITDAVEQITNQEQTFENTIQQLLERAGEAIAIVDEATHELYYCSSNYRELVPPKQNYHKGIRYEDYFFGAGSPRRDLESYHERYETIVMLPNRDRTVYVTVSPALWRVGSALLIRLREKNEQFYDLITGLPNMQYYSQYAERNVARMLARGLTPKILYFNLEGMKYFNSRYGFSKGDLLLKAMADILTSTFDDSVAFRFGADHFVVITSMDEIHELAETVIRKIRIPGRGIQCSVGCCIVDESRDADIMEVCDYARLTCESVHGSREVRYAEYTDALSEREKLEAYVATNIDHAILQGYVQLYMQPVIRTSTRSICGFEALARWLDPDEGMISPGIFIPALEDSNQIHKLDVFMVNKICHVTREALDLGLPVVPVSLNLSRLDFLECDIFTAVEAAVEKYQVPREYLRIEITESTMIAEENIRREIARFQQIGYQVWMDDFGSGYSSLNVLKDYDFDEVKIDMAFLENLNDRGRTIVSSTVGMSKQIGVQTLAEGVETEDQYEFLREIGCEKLQGYLFGRPMSKEECEAYLARPGIHVETPEEADYYDIVGSVNCLKNVATTVLEYEQNGQCHYLFANQLFIRELNALGISDLKTSEKLLANGKNRWGLNLYEGCCKSRELGKPYVLSFVLNNEMEIMNITHLASCGERDAYVVEMQRVSSSISSLGLNSYDKSLEHIFGMYQAVLSFDLDKNTVKEMYRSRASMMKGEANTLDEFIDKESTDSIHPDDRARYLEFMELATLKARTSEVSEETITDYFRIRQRDDSFRWYSLETASVGDGASFTHCARYLRNEAMQALLDEKYI